MIETDCLNATNTENTGLNLSAFPQELTNVFNNPVRLTSKFELDCGGRHANHVSSGQTVEYSMYEHSELISLTLLAKSFKTQISNTIRRKVPKDISILSSILGSSRQPESRKKAIDFMTYLLDITTHLAYYRKPVDPRLAVFIQAQFDSYMLNMESPSPLELWPGCAVEYVDSGHVFAAVYKQDVFRRIIAKTLEKC